MPKASDETSGNADPTALDQASEKTATTTLSYTLDSDDRIVSVGGDWDGFARENDGSEILARTVIGRRLDEFITGDATRMFVRTMLMSARTLKRSIRRPYRCDSPQFRRLMEMTIVPLAQEMLDVRHHQIRAEPLPYTITIAAVTSTAASGFVKRCSICNRIRAGKVWSEVDAAVIDGRLTVAATAALKVIYGVCPDCLLSAGHRHP
ncbi:hypothetical protein [Accumulibacter sp.]|jgi:hypothetical protein|uniref:Uncharacterized protein n=1 Tax=Accumulibacter regalis TaxID=522306 RepID=C7RN46_ACCRE|nr:hypothetical protein [Accumulibacter sp.]MBN8497404.1 hypothetical protein [Accumulibacter sp.]MBO3715351.1 hypothetical protein [Accumulibacter sp.]